MDTGCTDEVLPKFQKDCDIRKCVTSEFARKPRPLKEVDRWKATEFRTFLLYTGPIVLDGCLEPKYYRNFMCLSVAIRLLAEPGQSPENITYAESLLDFFVHTFKQLYGRENVSYNVHGLIHLANDVRKHGHLDQFSAFKFENHLSGLKRLIRSNRNALQQIHRRLVERQDFIEAKQNLTEPFLIGPTSPNNLILLKNKDILLVHSVNSVGDNQVLCGRKFNSEIGRAHV